MTPESSTPRIRRRGANTPKASRPISPKPRAGSSRAAGRLRTSPSWRAPESAPRRPWAWGGAPLIHECEVVHAQRPCLRWSQSGPVADPEDVVDRLRQRGDNLWKVFSSRIHGRSLSGAGCGRRPGGTDRQGFTSACPNPMAQLQNRESKLKACRCDWLLPPQPFRTCSHLMTAATVWPSPSVTSLQAGITCASARFVGLGPRTEIRRPVPPRWRCTSYKPPRAPAKPDAPVVQSPLKAARPGPRSAEVDPGGLSQTADHFLQHHWARTRGPRCTLSRRQGWSAPDAGR